MDPKTLKAGVVYQWSCYEKCICVGTVKYDGLMAVNPGFITSKTLEKGDHHNINEGIYTCKPATPKQIAHLNACLRADKFIPFSEINFNKIYELW